MKVVHQKRGKKIADYYPASEINLAYPKKNAKLDIALCFPNKYSIGTSNLGFLSIYRYLNDVKDIRCERFYFDPLKHQSYNDLRSLETNKALKDFDCLAFSLSYEIDLINIIRTISQSGIEVFSTDRKDDSPYIIMGGIVASINPEPAALFIDTFVLGDGEDVTIRLLELYLENKKKQFDPRFQLEASKLDGVYFPSSIEFNSDRYGNIESMKVKKGFPDKIRGNLIPDINKYATYSPIITPDTNFSSCCLIDVIRGCKRNCSFCVSGNICSTSRTRSPDSIKLIIEKMKVHTSRFGLIAPSLTDYPDLKQLISFIGLYKIEYTLASLRIDSFDENVIELIKKTNQKTVTIAPETGSERLRKFIKKPLTDKKLLSLFQELLDSGIFNFKLYFMIGLPTEKKEDIEGIVSVIKKVKHLMLKNAKGTKKIGNLNISASCFVPKPHTPFEYRSMESLEMLKWKLKFLKNAISKIDNVTFTADVPKWARIQGMISKGDRKVGLLLKKVLDLDGNFPRAFKEVNLNPDYYLESTYDKKFISPWNHINHTGSG